MFPRARWTRPRHAKTAIIRRRCGPRRQGPFPRGIARAARGFLPFRRAARAWLSSLSRFNRKNDKLVDLRARPGPHWFLRPRPRAILSGDDDDGCCWCCCAPSELERWRMRARQGEGREAVGWVMAAMQVVFGNWVGCWFFWRRISLGSLRGLIIFLLLVG